MKSILFLFSLIPFCFSTPITETVPTALGDILADPSKLPGFDDIPSEIDVLGFIKALPNLIKMSESLKRVSGNFRKLGKTPEKFSRLTGTPFVNVASELTNLASAIPKAQDPNGDLNLLKLRGINAALGRVTAAINKVSEHIELILKGSKAPKDSTDRRTGIKKLTDAAGVLANAIKKVHGLGGAAFGFAVKLLGVQKGISETSSAVVSLGNLQKDATDKTVLRNWSKALQKIVDAIDVLTRIEIN